MRFGRESEILGRRVHPSGNRAGGWHTSEGSIQLHRIELCGVVLQEAFGRAFLRKKCRLPARIRPAGCSNVQLHPPSINALFVEQILGTELAEFLQIVLPALPDTARVLSLNDCLENLSVGQNLD